MHSSRRKGAKAEREAAAVISDLLGMKVVRRYNLGTHEDTGDLIMEDTVIQVVDYKDVVRAVRMKPPECELQQAQAGATFGATFVRLFGGEWRVVLTPEQWCTYARESQA